MATCVGIELSPTACRIVELDSGASGDRRTSVRSFAVVPPSGPLMQSTLAGLRRRRAAVVVWGGRTEHRQMLVSAGSYESMRAEALARLAAEGVSTQGVWADIALGPMLQGDAARRTVMLSMASAVDMADALRPVRDAGIRLRTVTTAAVALSLVGRRRAAAADPNTIETYVAFDEQLTCVALMRRGMLLAARTLPWGFVETDYAGSGLRSRDEMASRLVQAIAEHVAAAGGPRAAMGPVHVGGGLPELRDMCAALKDQLGVDVRLLDSLFEIDATRLSSEEDEFRRREAELRLASAAAVDGPPVINLLRARRRQTSSAWLARAAVIAGAAAGLGGAWWFVEQGYLWPGGGTPQRVITVARPRAAVPRPQLTTPEEVPAAPAAVVQPDAPEINTSPATDPERG